MPRLWAVFLIGLLIVSPISANGSDDLRLRELAVQEAITKVEGSVACIIVSRSEVYRKYEDELPKEPAGILGGFNVQRALLGVPQQEQKPIRALDLGDPSHVPESFGSGVVLDKAGLILTCAHVVRGATKVYVRLPGGAGSYADIHALDTRSDLAVLRLIDRIPDLKPVVRGDGGKLGKGQFVVSVANPYAAGFEDGSPSASFGIVSNLRRRMPGGASENERNRLLLHQFGTLIQTDVRLNSGCSGGALINLKGEMVGLTTARAALVGVDTPGGFAVPMDEALNRIIDVLLRGEEVEYGFLGVQFDMDHRAGVRLSKVLENSPAWRAGLRDGDFLLSIGGRKVQTIDDVFLAIGIQLNGTRIELERGRATDGSGEKVTATLAKLHVPLPFLASKRPPFVAGLRVDHASLAVQRAGSGFSPVPTGVIIREVQTGSPADKAQLQPDKIIIEVNGRPVASPAEFYREMGGTRGEATLGLRSLGGPERVSLKLDPP